MPIYFQERTEVTDQLLRKITTQKEGTWYFTVTKRIPEYPDLRILLLSETITKSQTIIKKEKIWTIHLDFNEESWNEIVERSAKYPLVLECMLGADIEKRYPLFIFPILLPAIKKYNIKTKNSSNEIKKYFDTVQMNVVKKDFGTRLLIRMREK